MLMLHLLCNQGGPTSSGSCICIIIVDICNFVSTMGTMTKTHNKKQHNPNLGLNKYRVIECSGCIWVATKVAILSLVGTSEASLH